MRNFSSMSYKYNAIYVQKNIDRALETSEFFIQDELREVATEAIHNYMRGEVIRDVQDSDGYVEFYPQDNFPRDKKHLLKDFWTANKTYFETQLDVLSHEEDLILQTLLRDMMIPIINDIEEELNHG